MVTSNKMLEFLGITIRQDFNNTWASNDFISNVLVSGYYDNILSE